VLGDEAVKWFRSQEYYDSGAWRGTRDMDGGVLLNQAIHGIDRLQWLMGGVESVQAQTDTIGREMECESAAAMSLRFRNGAIGTISATTATKGGTDRTDINGTEGTLSLSATDSVSLTIGTGEEAHMNAETESCDIDVDHFEWGEGHAAVVQDFVDAVREDREPAVPGREARKAVDIILAAYASDARGETVSVDDVREGRIPEANADDA
jgi:predicted dehydrogenase